MSATTPRKRKASKLVQRGLARSMFKKGTNTSDWSEVDAKNFFNMIENKDLFSTNTYSICRSNKDDISPTAWSLNKDETVTKHLLSEVL